MKKFILAAGLLATTLTMAAESFKSPDIMVETKLDYDFTDVLVKKFRALAKSFNMNDPFQGRFPEPILLNESELSSLLPASSKDLMKDFGNAVGLNVLKAETKVWMHGLSYNVKGFKTNLKANGREADGLIIGTNFTAEEINVTADKISISLVIPGKTNSPVFTVDVVKPVIRANAQDLIKFYTEIKIQTNKEHFNLQIKDANFDQMAKKLITNQEDINLGYERVIIPEVSLRIGNKTVNFSPEKITALIKSYHPAIKGILLAQGADILRSNTAEAALKVVEQYKLPKEHWLSAPIFQSQFKLERFAKSTDGENIQTTLSADFCTNENFKANQKECGKSKITQTSPSRLTNALHRESRGVIRDLMTNGDANIVASVSEDYINKLLVATYDAGLWNDSLEKSGVKLGSNHMTLRLDQKGDTGSFIMDVVYTPSRMEKLLTGSTVIRFPLAINISLRIEKRDEVPFIIVRLHDVDTSDETIINGRDGFDSSVKTIPRFQAKVAKAVREKITALSNKDLLELKYPELKGLSLDKVDFLSDGNGRMNAVLRMEDILQDQK